MTKGLDSRLLALWKTLDWQPCGLDIISIHTEAVDAHSSKSVYLNYGIFSQDSNTKNEWWAWCAYPQIPVGFAVQQYFSSPRSEDRSLSRFDPVTCRNLQTTITSLVFLHHSSRGASSWPVAAWRGYRGCGNYTYILTLTVTWECPTVGSTSGATQLLACNSVVVDCWFSPTSNSKVFYICGFWCGR